MTSHTQYLKRFNFIIAFILCLMFLLATHILTKEFIYKLIDKEVSSRIDTLVQLHTKNILDHLREKENQYMVQNLFKTYGIEPRLKRDIEDSSLKGLCKAIQKQCSIKLVPGPPGLPGFRGEKGEKGDMGVPGHPGVQESPNN